MNRSKTAAAGVLALLLVARTALPLPSLAAAGRAVEAVEGRTFREIVAVCHATGAAPTIVSFAWDAADPRDQPGSAAVVPLGNSAYAIVDTGSVFASAGFRRGSVTIEDALQSRTTVEFRCLVGDFAPVLGAASLERGTDGVTVTLHAAYEDSTSETHTLRVDWGDGTVETIDLAAAATGQVAPSHAYSAKSAAALFAARPRLHVIATLADERIAPGTPVVLPSLLEGASEAGGAASRTCEAGPAAACSVERVYRDLLGRRPTAAEMAAHVAAAADDAGRGALAAELLASSEARLLRIRGAFARLLGRKPTKAEIAALTTKSARALGEGSSDVVAFFRAAGSAGGLPADGPLAADPAAWGDDPAIAAVFGSDAYFARSGGTNAAFVRAFVPEALGRPALPADQAKFETSTAAGGTRESFVLSVLASAEAQVHLVHHASRRLLREAPSAAVLADATASLAAGAPPAQIIAVLIGLRQYHDRAPQRRPLQPLSGRPPLQLLGQMYCEELGVLHPDRRSAASLAAAMDAGLAPSQLAGVLAASETRRRREVERHYRNLLGRAPTQQEEDAAIIRLAGLDDALDLESSLLGSPEFFDKSGGNDTAFLQALVRACKGGGEVAIEELHFYGALLAGGTSRESVARHLLGTDAVVAARVDALSRRFRLRAADGIARAVFARTLRENRGEERTIAAMLVHSLAAHQDALQVRRAGIRSPKTARAFVEAARTALTGSAAVLPEVDDQVLLRTAAGTDGPARTLQILGLTGAALGHSLSGTLGITILDQDGETEVARKRRGGATEEDVLEAMLSSQEFSARAHLVATGTPGPGTDAEVVTEAFRVLLGRDPTADELAFHLVGIGSGADPVDAIAAMNMQLLALPEFREQQAEAAHFAAKGRSAPPEVRRALAACGVSYAEFVSLVITFPESHADDESSARGGGSQR